MLYINHFNFIIKIITEIIETLNINETIFHIY